MAQQQMGALRRGLGRGQTSQLPGAVEPDDIADIYQQLAAAKLLPATPELDTGTLDLPGGAADAGKLLAPQHIDPSLVRDTQENLARAHLAQGALATPLTSYSAKLGQRAGQTVDTPLWQGARELLGAPLAEQALRVQGGNEARDVFNKYLLAKAGSTAEGRKMALDVAGGQARADEAQSERDFMKGEGDRDRQNRIDIERLKLNKGRYRTTVNPIDGTPVVTDQQTGGIVMHGSGGGSIDPASVGLTPDAVEQAADLYAKTGKMEIAKGRPAARIAALVASRAAAKYPDADLAGERAAYSADAGSLKKQQGQSDAINAFENTALANLGNMLNIAKTQGLSDSGSPYFNRPLRTLDEKALGKENVAAFHAARQVASTEISRVLSGQSGMQLSDAARKEASDLLSPDATVGQLVAASNVLKQDMENRRSSQQQQIDTTKGRLKKKPPGARPEADDEKFKAFLKSLQEG